jgi:hypothetical protein
MEMHRAASLSFGFDVVNEGSIHALCLAGAGTDTKSTSTTCHFIKPEMKRNRATSSTRLAIDFIRILGRTLVLNDGRYATDSADKSNPSS